jgi:hypothetical protein
LSLRHGNCATVSVDAQVEVDICNTVLAAANLWLVGSEAKAKQLLRNRIQEKAATVQPFMLRENSRRGRNKPPAVAIAGGSHKLTTRSQAARNNVVAFLVVLMSAYIRASRFGLVFGFCHGTPDNCTCRYCSYRIQRHVLSLEKVTVHTILEDRPALARGIY